MELGPYSLVPGEDKEHENARAIRPKLLRTIGRRIRSMSAIPALGRNGTVAWLIASTWRPFVFYSAYGGGCIMYWYRTGHTVHEALFFPDKVSTISATLQFLAAFLTGLTISEAAARYKAAMASLLEFRDATEALRVSLCSSTPDPKLRVSVHIFISWMICIFQKTIVFFTEDFTDPLRTFIPNESQLWDRKEKTIEKIWARMLNALKELHELLQVRSPTTKFTVGNIAVNLFLISIPLVNADLVSPVALPVVAAMFYAVLRLSFELGDPWGEGADGLHDLPLLDVMRYLSLPMFSETDLGDIDSSVEWLSMGLQAGAWTYTQGEHQIPRHRALDPNKGELIDFKSMRTLSEVAGYKSWESFMFDQGQDMTTAEQNGRRLPTYLRWNACQSNGSVGGPVRADEYV